MQRAVEPEARFISEHHESATCLGFFFNHWKGLPEPDGLCFEVGPSQTLARALYRETELIQHPRHMVVVVLDAEVVLDEVADHGSRPHTTGVSRCLWARFDPCRQFVLLVLGQLGCAPGRCGSAKSLDPNSLIPL